jgi:hypothetical protein
VSGWQTALLAYVTAATATFLPVLRLLVRKVKPNGGGPGFDDSPHFTPEEKLLLSQHYERLRGTLGFWKTAAARYKAFHVYALAWITISTVMVPILAQAVGTDQWSKWFLSVVGAHAALLLAATRTFRIESSFKAFRQAESEFYDQYRRLLDRPQAFGKTREEQLPAYFETVERVRQLARSAEIDNLPSVEDALQTPPNAPKAST